MKITSIHYAGNAWRSTMKGTDWICEDLVLGYVRHLEDRITGSFILADGASLANGREAIHIVKNAFTARPWNNPGQDALIPGITETVSAMHSSALANNAETTLVLCVVLSIADQPILSVIKFGNSNYLITHQPPDRDRLVWVKGSNLVPLPPIGSVYLHIDTKVIKRFLYTVPLQRHGTWNMTAFSDGVLDGKDKAMELILQYTSLEALVKSAALWDKTTPYFGHDDWSVAGMEIKVEE